MFSVVYLNDRFTILPCNTLYLCDDLVGIVYCRFSNYNTTFFLKKNVFIFISFLLFPVVLSPFWEGECTNRRRFIWPVGLIPKMTSSSTSWGFNRFNSAPVLSLYPQIFKSSPQPRPGQRQGRCSSSSFHAIAPPVTVSKLSSDRSRLLLSGFRSTFQQQDGLGQLSK